MIEVRVKRLRLVDKIICIQIFERNLAQNLNFSCKQQDFFIYIDDVTVVDCYDPSYAPMLVAMLVAMLMTIAGRSPLGYRVVPRPTLFRVSLCSPESYR